MPNGYIRMMVLNDGETCTEIDGTFVVDFDSDEDANEFADYGNSRFNLQATTDTAEVPVYKAIRRDK